MESRGGKGRIARAAAPEGQDEIEAQGEIEARSQAQNYSRKKAQPIRAEARLTPGFTHRNGRA